MIPLIRFPSFDEKKRREGTTSFIQNCISQKNLKVFTIIQWDTLREFRWTNQHISLGPLVEPQHLKLMFKSPGQLKKKITTTWCWNQRICPEHGAGWWYSYPSEKWWSSSVGMMTFPTEWKNKSHVPNRQPVFLFPLKKWWFISNFPIPLNLKELFNTYNHPYWVETHLLTSKSC